MAALQAAARDQHSIGDIVAGQGEQARHARQVIAWAVRGRLADIVAMGSGIRDARPEVSQLGDEIKHLRSAASGPHPARSAFAGINRKRYFYRAGSCSRLGTESLR